MLKTMSHADWRKEFRTWVEKQPDYRVYIFVDDTVCPVRQFMTEVLAMPIDTPFTGDVPVVYATHSDYVVRHDGGLDRAVTALGGTPRTFGALKRRLAESHWYN